MKAFDKQFQNTDIDVFSRIESRARLWDTREPFAQQYIFPFSSKNLGLSSQHGKDL